MWVFTDVIQAQMQQAIPKLPDKVQHVQTIDFSILDSILGGFAAVAAFLIVGFFLVKYNVVKIGASPVREPEAPRDMRVLICPDNCPSHSAEHERSIGNQKLIDELFRKYNELKESTNKITTDLALLKAGQDQMLTLLTKISKR